MLLGIEVSTGMPISAISALAITDWIMSLSSSVRWLMSTAGVVILVSVLAEFRLLKLLLLLL